MSVRYWLTLMRLMSVVVVQYVRMCVNITFIFGMRFCNIYTFWNSETVNASTAVSRAYELNSLCPCNFICRLQGGERSRRSCHVEKGNRLLCVYCSRETTCYKESIDAVSLCLWCYITIHFNVCRLFLTRFQFSARIILISYDIQQWISQFVVFVYLISLYLRVV